MQNDPPSQLEERLQGHAPGDSHPTAPHTRPRRLKRGDEEPFAMVVLPSKPSGRHSKPLPPPGGAQRVVNGPPVPPPRPEHTLSSRSRPIVAKPVESGTGIRNNNNNNNTTATPGSGIMELVSLPARTTVTLTTPRCEAEREKNLYTEAPQKVLPQHQHQTPLLSVIQNQPVTAAVTAVTAAGTANLKKKVGSGGLVSELDDLVILSEPNKQSSESIFCQNCGKCKCEACCRPRKLPQKWLCSGTFLCSKTTVVDALSCMCCVKGLFYHCTKDLDDEEAVTDGVTDEEQPCSCQGPHVLGKWAAMTMLIPVLPCLLTYPLLGACAQCAEQVYARVTASGCQCQKVHKASNQESLSSRPMLCSSVSTHARSTQSKSP